MPKSREPRPPRAHNSTLPRPTKPIARSKPPKRGGRLKVSNRERRAANFARAYGSDERVAWIQHQPSIASGQRPCVNAHVKNGGVGRKADAKWIVPLTDAEHQELHRIGVASFEAKYGLSLEYHAERIEILWQRHQKYAAPLLENSRT